MSKKPEQTFQTQLIKEMMQLKCRLVLSSVSTCYVSRSSDALGDIIESQHTETQKIRLI